MKRVHIFASLLAVEHTKTLQEWKRVEPYVHGVHIDVMDGVFVKQKTRFTATFAKSVKTKKVKDVHFMVCHPERILRSYVQAGAHIIDIHIESLKSPLTTLLTIKRRFPKLKIFLALNPETSARAVYPCIPFIDGILCMTVRPGRGGQTLIPSVVQKIRRLHVYAPTMPIMVDGGINGKTAQRARTAGATILVSGSHIFHAENPRMAVRALLS